jgi:outer membrane lipoprotein-sorting protein
MLKSISKSLVTLALLLAFVNVASAQTADEVIEKHLAALGGRPAFSKLTSRLTKGTISVTTPVGEVTGSIEIYNQAPNKQRTFIQLDLTGVGLGKVVQDQRFDGTSGYMIDSLQGNREITGEQLEPMKNSSFPNPLLNYKEMGTTVELAGKEKVGDRDAYVLVGKPKSGPAVRQYIDAQTYLPIKTVVKINVPQLGTEVEQTSEMSDFREVDGIKIPFHVTQVTSLQSLTVTFSQVEHNTKIDQSVFSKPDAGTGK